MKEQTEGEKKLSQLLGEYMEEKKKNPEGFLEISTVLMTGSKAMDVYMISKSFGFIKRLIKKDKINIDKIPEIGEIYSDCNELIRYCYIVLEDDIYPKDCCLLMLLAISDTPIEDLISYLK